MLVAVPREEDVKFRGMCDARGVPVLRIGVTDSEGDQVEFQDHFTVSIDELRATNREPLERFA